MTSTAIDIARQNARRQDGDPELPSVIWTLITRESLDLGRKFLDVMADMDRHYREEEPGQVCERMVSEGCRYYYGAGPGFEVVIGYQWNANREKYQARTAGFRGILSPHDALRLIVEQGRRFLHDVGQSCVYTIVPRAMDNPRIMQMHGLVPWCPELKVSGGHHVEGGTYWKLELVSSAGQEKTVQNCGQ